MLVPKMKVVKYLTLNPLVVIQTQGLVEATELPRGDTLGSVLSATIHPDIKRTLVSMSERTGMTVSQVADEVLYTGLIEMQELDLPEG